MKSRSSYKTRMPEAPPMRLNDRGRRFFGGLALVATLLTAGTVVNAHKGPSKEVAIMKDWENGTKTPKAVNSKFILRSDVVLRRSPQRINDSADVRANVDSVVKKGMAVVVSEPIIYTDQQGRVDTRWLGFSMVTADTSDASPEAVAKRTVWVNWSELSGQKSTDGQPYITQIPLGEPLSKPQMDVQLVNGQFRVDTGQGPLPVAFAQTVAESNIQAIGRAA